MADNSQQSSNDLNLSEYNYDEIASKSIFELLDLDLPEEKKQAMEEKMMATVKNRAMARISDALSDEDTETWEGLSDEAAKQKFLADKDINIGKIMLEEALTHKLELLSLGKTLKDTIEENA